MENFRVPQKFRAQGTGPECPCSSQGLDRHLLSLTVYDRTVSSRQLVARWSTAISVLVSASLIHRRQLHCRLRASVPLYRILLTTNYHRLHTQCVHEHRAGQADWHQAVFSDESTFNFLDHDIRVRVRHYGCQHCLPKCVYSDIVTEHAKLHSGK